MSARGKLAASAASIVVLGLCWQLGGHARAQVAAQTGGGRQDQTTPSPSAEPTPSEVPTATPDEPTDVATTPEATTPGATTPGKTPGHASSTAATPTPSPSATSALGEGRYLGQWTPYKYGQLRVSVDIKDGKIVNVLMNERVSEDKSTRINKTAHATLREEVIAAQSSKVGTVSGATYTAQAYRTSLQYALDAAKTG